MYSGSPKGNLQVHGHTIYQLFTTVVILGQNVRQAGSDPDAVQIDSAASSASPEDAGGLHPVLLAAQSRVMLTANIWQEVGLCNGASGTIQHLLYNDNHRPPHLPVAILVEFDNYSGHHFSVNIHTGYQSLH